MSQPRACPVCGIEVPPNAPAGICPACLLKAGLANESAVGDSLPRTQITPPAASGFVPPSPAELAGLFPQLEILELLGKGGMGAVYKARQPGLDRLVALKILPPEISNDPAFTERFQREARALARLNHPHIVAVYDFGQTGGLCYIVMEFVDGVNLRQTIRTGTLTSAEALAIVPQICEALQFAHDEGIVHRDIKPENILIDKRGRVKIADFGLAKLLGQDAGDHSLTATHQVMGTLRYMAPEQMQGSRAVDHRADIYSLGVVFYELLTGELPMGKFAPPSKRVQVDVRLDEIVLRALEQQPEQRYQHASEVKTDVDAISRSPSSLRGVPARSVALPAESQPQLFGGTEPNNLPTVSPQIRRQLRGPAFALMVYSLLPIFLALPCLTYGFKLATGFDANRVTTGLALIASSFLLFGLSGLMLLGGWQMLAVQSYRAAVLGSFLGQPIGMWGLYVLSHPEVKSAFASIARDRSRTKRLSSGHPAESDRPPLVLVFATIDLIAAVVLMLICSAPDALPYPESESRLWHVWSQVEVVLGFLVGAAMFAASIALFLWKPWARQLVLGVCFFWLASLVVDMPYLTRAALPMAWEEIRLTEIEHGLNVEDAAARASIGIVIGFGGLLIVVLTWLIAHLIYFTRPQIVAAFESRGEKPSKMIEWLFTGTGAIVGVLSVIGPIALLVGIVALFNGWSSDQTTSGVPDSVPPLGTITNGIGAEFTVPAGQVAMLEIVTRRDKTTVPIPSHCGYVMALPEKPAAASFRWSHTPQADGSRKSWSVEIVTAGSGGGHVGGLLLPEELDSQVGSRGLGLGLLESNEETIHWGNADANNLPDNGLIGLRVSVVPHGLKKVGAGVGQIDWQKTPPPSMTRRKLP